MKIIVCHFSPGTSKWNKIERRLFSFIAKNWRGKPLGSLEIIVNLEANTITQKGLKVKALTDEREYKKGLKVTDEKLEKIKLERNTIEGNGAIKSCLNVSVIHERILRKILLISEIYREISN